MLKRPLITEKTMLLAKNGLYTFEVLAAVTKFEIAKLVKDKFKVDVMSVKMINTKSKQKMQRTRRGHFQTAAFKKAIVRVKPGQKIALFELAAAVDEEVSVTTAEGEKVGTVKEKKSLLRGTKVKVEKVERGANVAESAKDRKSRQQTGKTKGEK